MNFRGEFRLPEYPGVSFRTWFHEDSFHFDVTATLRIGQTLSEETVLAKGQTFNDAILEAARALGEMLKKAQP